MGLETFLPCTTLFSVFRDMKYSKANRHQIFRLKYAKLFCLKSLLILSTVSCSQTQPSGPISVAVEENDSISAEIPIVVGAERTDQYVFLLKGKTVGIVGNQSSLIDEVHLVDSLLSLGVKVKKVFSPEHGFRGDADAGEYVSSAKDKRTGLPVVSLYGQNKKPTAVQLSGLDVVVFDIQDVGVRFYTYISTLHYVMEACAENNIPVIVLDRPNPNGHYIDGPVLDMNYKSFVGMHPVPIVYGMTIGEYGKMINGEGWLESNKQCDLQVIPCDNYYHQTPYSLPVPPSPNLRSDVSIQLYPSLCLLEATTVTVGRGTEGPFERYGHPKFPKTEFSFTPKPGYGSKKPKFNGEVCHGYNLNDTNYHRMNAIDLSFLLNSSNLLKTQLFDGKEKFFNLLAGNNILLSQIKSGMTNEAIHETWKESLDGFRHIRSKYLLYTD